jgi:hypothetical protein
MLAIDKPQLRGHYSDAHRGLRCALSYARGRLAQLTDHMGPVIGGNPGVERGDDADVCAPLFRNRLARNGLVRIELAEDPGFHVRLLVSVRSALPAKIP